MIVLKKLKYQRNLPRRFAGEISQIKKYGIGLNGMGQDQQWRRKLIEKEKAAIKAELDAAYRESPQKRMNLIMQRIRELENGETSLDQLRCYIYIVSALAHHLSEGGGLTLAQINRLANFAHIILRVQGIKPNVSHISFVYGELHLALSRIYRDEGEPILAAWEQDMATRLAHGGSSFSEGMTIVSQAIRVANLGYGLWALTLFEQAEGLGLNRRYLVLSQLGRLRLLRLLHRYDEADSLSNQMTNGSDLSDKEKSEIHWEKLCREAQKSGNIIPLLQAASKRGSHYEPIYTLEAQLWFRSIQNPPETPQPSKVRTLSRDIKIHQAGFLYECVKELEQCIDENIPFEQRLRSLGQKIARHNELVNIDIQLLFLAASARWLATKQSSFLTSVTLREYRTLCWNLSDGHINDSTSLLGDIINHA